MSVAPTLVNKAAVAVVVAVIGLGLTFPSFTRTLSSLPLRISFGSVIAAAVAIAKLIKSDGHDWEAASPGNRIRHALRPLIFTTPSAWSAVQTRQSWEAAGSAAGFPPIHRSAPPSLNLTIDIIFSLIRRSFILPWFNRVSPSASFPDGVEILLRYTSADLIKRAETVDWSTLMVARIIPIITAHVHHYRMVEDLSSASAAPPPHPALPLPLPRFPHRALLSQDHVSTNMTSPSIEAHLRGMLGRLVQESLPESDRSEVVAILAKEVALGAVLLPVFDMLCEGDYWNQQIDERGGRYLHEQKQVNKFLSVLSAAPASATSSPRIVRPRGGQSASTNHFASSITADSSTRQFETFIRSIPKLKTLGDARRLRADVEREQRLVRSTIGLAAEVHELDVHFKSSRRYAKRLERAKADIDNRINHLSRQSGNLPTTLPPSVAPNTALSRSITLYKVLGDTSSLAYWLEFMDRRGRSRLVQYWLTVEGFKDPLEAAGQYSAVENTTASPNTVELPGNSETTSEDVAFLSKCYFAQSDVALDVPPKLVETIKAFGEKHSDTVSATERQQARHAVFSSQQAVYEQMEQEDWPDFRKNDLYLKAISDLSRSKVVTPPAANSVPFFDTVAQASPQPFRPIRHTSSIMPLFSPHSNASSNDPRSPTSRPSPALVNGGFTPGSAYPSAGISLATPLFSRRLTEPVTQLGKLNGKVSEGDVDIMTSSTPSLLASPANFGRRSSHLDFLVSKDGESATKTRLFEDDEAEEMADEVEDDGGQLQRMEAIQAALNEIIASDIRESPPADTPVSVSEPGTAISPTFSVSRARHADEDPPARGRLVSKSMEDFKSPKVVKPASSAPQSRKPSTKSAAPPQPALLHRSSMSKILERSDKGLFDEAANSEEEVELLDDVERNNEVHSDRPVELSNFQLPVEIGRLQDRIEDLVKQEHMLGALTRQAELTGSQSELRILQRSLTLIRREQRSSIFQKAQYEQQDEDKRLVPGRSRITIPSFSFTVEDQDKTKQVVRYTIEVKQIGEDGHVLLSWRVTRRYNDFFELDRALRELSLAEGNLTLLSELKSKVTELPGKKLVPSTSGAFIETRRLGLERYLQSLVSSGPVCGTPVLGSFLSLCPVNDDQSNAGQSGGSVFAASALAPHNIVKSLYKTMATSLDDTLLGPSMLDLMYTTLSRQLNEVADGVGGYLGAGGDELAGLGSALLPSGLRAVPYASGTAKTKLATSFATEGKHGEERPFTMQPIGGETGLGSFTAPICDLFIEIFDLKENNWLRRQAIVVILQQFLGGTIERKVRDSVRNTLSASSMERILAGFKDSIWPGGIRRPPSTSITEEKRNRTRSNASKKLGLLIPDMAANMIGRGNARRAARRVFGVLQDRRLNQQLLLCILDELFNALYPPRA